MTCSNLFREYSESSLFHHYYNRSWVLIIQSFSYMYTLFIRFLKRLFIKIKTYGMVNPKWRFSGIKNIFHFGNPNIPNIDAISGALFTLRIQYEYTQTQRDEGARDDIDIWYMMIIIFWKIWFCYLLSVDYHLDYHLN